MRKRKGDVVRFNRHAYFKFMERQGENPHEYLAGSLEEREYVILDVRGTEDEYYYELKKGIFVHPIWCQTPKDN